jgi:type VI protein secretion system component Hcp
MSRSSRIHRIVVSSLIAGAVALGPVAAWAFTATLSIPSLCASPINIVAFSAETSNTLSSGGGGGAGKATIKPLVLTKAVDECTPLLFKAAFTGQHFQTATLQVSTKKTTFTIQLTDLIVTDLKHEFSKMGPGAGDDVLLETVTLDSAALSFTSGGTTVQCSQQTNSCQ